MHNSYISLSNLCLNNTECNNLIGGGAISKEVAEQARDKYYSVNSGKYKSEDSANNAKLLDMASNKTNSKILDLNNDNASKYLGPNGPKKYDIMGIDAFDEGTEIEIGDKKVVNRGEHKTKDNTLYSEYFKTKYQQTNPDGNLVEKHWEKYYKEKEELKRIKDENTILKKLLVDKGIILDSEIGDDDSSEITVQENLDEKQENIEDTEKIEVIQAKYKGENVYVYKNADETYTVYNLSEDVIAESVNEDEIKIIESAI